MSTRNMHLKYSTPKRYPTTISIVPPGVALIVTFRGSNYRCLEQIFMVPKGLEPSKFDCMLFAKLYMTLTQAVFDFQSNQKWLIEPKGNKKLSQRTTKPTIRLTRSAKTRISLRIRAVWSESSLIACAFYSLKAIQRGMNKHELCPAILGECTRWSESLLVTQVLL